MKKILVLIALLAVVALAGIAQDIAAGHMPWKCECHHG